jgi:hypothetical protein
MSKGLVITCLSKGMRISRGYLITSNELASLVKSLSTICHHFVGFSLLIISQLLYIYCCMPTLFLLPYLALVLCSMFLLGFCYTFPCLNVTKLAFFL